MLSRGGRRADSVGVNANSDGKRHPGGAHSEGGRWVERGAETECLRLWEIFAGGRDIALAGNESKVSLL